MSTATLMLITAHDEIMAPFPVIAEYKKKIEALLEDVELHKDGQSAGDTTAKTKTKNELLTDLVKRSAKLARKASGLAKVTDDNELLSAVNFPEYKIIDGTDRDTLDVVDKILNAARAKEAVLMEQYNLVEGEIASLQAIVERVYDLLDERRVSSSSGKASTSNLSEAIDELRDAWDVMDDLIEGIVDNEEFLDTYDNTLNSGEL